MRCGWLQGYSSCSATDKFQGQSLILSCDVTASTMKLLLEGLLPKAISALVSLSRRSCGQHEILLLLGDFSHFGLVKCVCDTVMFTNTAPSSGTAVSGAF